jgi:hypothetical protein
MIWGDLHMVLMVATSSPLPMPSSISTFHQSLGSKESLSFVLGQKVYKRVQWDCRAAVSKFR